MSGDDLASYFDAASALLGLPVRPEDRQEALAAFAVLVEQAIAVTDFPLPGEVEAAPRFLP